MARFVTKAAVLMLLFLPALASWAGDAHWIDVRTADEYASGHVSGAVHIPYEEIGVRISEVTADKDALIYVYCRSGRRSSIAEESLRAMGYTNLINAGGYDDLKVALDSQD